LDGRAYSGSPSGSRNGSPLQLVPEFFVLAGDTSFDI
jgi:hypothetical protein